MMTEAEIDRMAVETLRERLESRDFVGPDIDVLKNLLKEIDSQNDSPTTPPT